MAKKINIVQNTEYNLFNCPRIRLRWLNTPTATGRKSMRKWEESRATSTGSLLSGTTGGKCTTEIGRETMCTENTSRNGQFGLIQWWILYRTLGIGAQISFRFRVAVRNRFGLSDPSPYCVAHRSNFADEEAQRPREMFLQEGEKFDLSKSKRFVRFGLLQKSFAFSKGNTM